MKPLLIGSLAFVMLGVLSAQEPAAPPDDNSPVMLFPILKDGKWGYMDQKGKVAIEPQYQLAWDFYEGLACVGNNALRGFIDRTGTLVIPLKYGWAGRFAEGLALVHTNNSRFGSHMQWYQPQGGWIYIDKTGAKVVDSYGYGGRPDDFSEGLGWNGRQFLGRDGKPAAFDGEEADSFSEGLAPVRKGELWGYIDRTMKPVIPPQFAIADAFSEGLAAVGKADAVPAPPARGSKVPSFKWGFVDKTGKLVIDCQFEDAMSFSEGLAPVRLGGKWGYVDKSGAIQPQYDPQYDRAWPFSEGMARVMVGDKQGFIDKQGKLVVQPQYQPAWEFSKGLARVAIDGEEGYIDAKGNYVWEPTK